MLREGIDSGTRMGKAMLSIAAVFAEMERDNIRTQTMSGREEKARKGYWNGGQAPYGYRLVDKGNKFKELEVDEEEAKVVRRIFEMYAYENKGAMAITAWLNNHGIKKTPRGNARSETFSNGTVHRMIPNPVYIGKIAYGRRRIETIDGTRGKTTWAYYCPRTTKSRGASCTFKSQYPQYCVDAEVVQIVSLASRSDAFVEALRRRINDETDVEQLQKDIERIEGEKTANDKRMRMLISQIDSLDTTDRSYERKFNDLRRTYMTATPDSAKRWMKRKLRWRRLRSAWTESEGF